jgi:uncharacterized protein (TIGR00297 family)
MATSHYILIVALLTGAAYLSVRLNKLTIAGGIVGAIVGFLVFMGGALSGLMMLAAFFILGTLATSWKKTEKLRLKPESDRTAKRDAWQVLANGGVAAILGLLAMIMPSESDLFRLMMAASLASATADTLSSELGMIYGRRFFNILTLKKEQKGLDGVISVEGLLIGIIGSAIIAAIYLACRQDISLFWWIIVCGTIGNLADSLLGALLERKGLIGNNLVNFLNTLTAAIMMWVVLTFILHYQP